MHGVCLSDGPRTDYRVPFKVFHEVLLGYFTFFEVSRLLEEIIGWSLASIWRETTFPRGVSWCLALLFQINIPRITRKLRPSFQNLNCSIGRGITAQCVQTVPGRPHTILILIILTIKPSPFIALTDFFLLAKEASRLLRDPTTDIKETLFAKLDFGLPNNRMHLPVSAMAIQVAASLAHWIQCAYVVACYEF